MSFGGDDDDDGVRWGTIRLVGVGDVTAVRFDAELDTRRVMDSDWARVRPEHTHKRDSGAVLLRRTRRVGDASMLFEIARPDAGPCAGLSDSTLVAEWTRQTVIASAHHHYDVPIGFAFVMRQLQVELLAPVLGVTPSVLIVTADVVRKGGHVRGLRAWVYFQVAGRLVARGYGDLQVLTPAVYGRVRSGGRCSADLTRASGQERPVDLERIAPQRWRVRFDPHDRFFFDHPLDHVPGMLLFEAARGLAVALSEYGVDDLVSFDGVFCQYAELDEVLEFEVTGQPQSGGRTHTELRAVGANDRTVLVATAVTTRRPSRRRAAS